MVLCRCILLWTILCTVGGQEDVVGAGATTSGGTGTGQTGSPEDTSESTTNATTPSTTEPTTTPASTRAPRECVNLQPLCIFWKIHGECQKNPDFMEFNCRKTCKKCDSYPASIDVVLPGNKSYPCNDDHDLCLFWSKRDQCNRNFYWMLKHCPFSCGYCSSKCRICLPPSETPPGLEDVPILYYNGRPFRRGDTQLIDFTNYQIYIPPEAFGLHGNPDIDYHRSGTVRRAKRGKPQTYRPQPQSKQGHHHHGGGSAWTVLPAYRPCGPFYHPDDCPTVAPSPCCIPVYLADKEGLLPIGAFVTPAPPATPSGLLPVLSVGSEGNGGPSTKPTPAPSPTTKAATTAAGSAESTGITTLAPAPPVESAELVVRARKIIRLRKLPQ